MTPGFPAGDGVADGDGAADGGRDASGDAVAGADASRWVPAGAGAVLVAAVGVADVPQPAMPVRASRDSS
jgi:hypothetical protein